MSVGGVAKTVLLGLLGKMGRWVHRQGWTILTYHALDDRRTIVSTPFWQFETQMEYLKREGYHVSSLRPLADHLHKGMSLPPRTVFLTFDDGLECIYTLVYPVLERLGFGATVFLATDYMGKTTQWYRQAGIPGHPVLDWDQVADLLLRGMDFQGHTCSHPHLTQLSLQEADREMKMGKDVIEHRTSRPVGLFAYPFGEYNGALMELAARVGFVGSLTTDIGLFQYGQHPHAIRRMGLNYLTCSDRAQATFAIDTCLGGTLALYRQAVRGFLRFTKGNVLGSSSSPGRLG